MKVGKISKAILLAVSMTWMSSAAHAECSYSDQGGEFLVSGGKKVLYSSLSELLRDNPGCVRKDPRVGQTTDASCATVSDRKSGGDSTLSGASKAAAGKSAAGVAR